MGQRLAASIETRSLQDSEKPFHLRLPEDNSPCRTTSSDQGSIGWASAGGSLQRDSKRPRLGPKSPTRNATAHTDSSEDSDSVEFGPSRPMKLPQCNKFPGAKVRRIQQDRESG